MSKANKKERKNLVVAELMKMEQGERSDKRPPAKLLTPGAEWRMEVDLGRKLQFPQTPLRPNGLFSSNNDRVHSTMGRGTRSGL